MTATERNRVPDIYRALYGHYDDSDVLRKQRIRNWIAKGMPVPTRPEPTHCELCGELLKRVPHLDYDRATLVFRGWLCRRCNTGLERLGDDASNLHRAIDYLCRPKV